ncbi:hypothetical protein KPZU09_31750 [Klebsiella pneumoniae]|uniref:Uncharacterized protein n=1 Tax=Klebsiella pneumoniae TaxID=573 RepID=A0A919HRP0_KLEPN|nr:hypothetical protein KPZU09_31750 [Klebsiella pneumoniae]
MPSFPTHLTRLLQGLFTLLLTLFGLLLVTFSLSALSPVDRVLQIVGDHASQSTYDRFAISWVSTSRCRCSSGTTVNGPWRSWHRQRHRPAGAPRPAGGLSGDP